MLVACVGFISTPQVLQWTELWFTSSPRGLVYSVTFVCWLPGDFFFISDMVLFSPLKDMCLIQTFKESVKTNIYIHLSHITKNILR